LRAGVRNTLFSSRRSPLLPRLSADLYSYLYFFNPNLPKTVAKIGTAIGLDFPSVAVRGNFAWNPEELVWDFTNVKTEWTVNEDLAFGLEFRHRSRFDWRKADHESFILDFARSPSELLITPLSDGRNTFLTKVQVRLSPRITCHFQSHHGWGRKIQPGYNAAKLDISTLLSCRWLFKLSIQYNPVGGFSPTAAISLVK
jgi:hypothetical protein